MMVIMWSIMLKKWNIENCYKTKLLNYLKVQGSFMCRR